MDFPDNGQPNNGKRCLAEWLLNSGRKKVKISLCLRSAPFCRLNRKSHSQHFKRCLQTGKSPYFNSYHNNHFTYLSISGLTKENRNQLWPPIKRATLWCAGSPSHRNVAFSISNCLHRCFSCHALCKVVILRVLKNMLAAFYSRSNSQVMIGIFRFVNRLIKFYVDFAGYLILIQPLSFTHNVLTKWRCPYEENIVLTVLA